MDSRKRHPKHALTAQHVKHAKATGSAYRLADGGGLYLLVSPNGTRSWVLRTVVKGRRSDIGLGSVAVILLAGGARRSGAAPSDCPVRWGPTGRAQARAAGSPDLQGRRRVGP